jgi:hypothetical protein
MAKLSAVTVNWEYYFFVREKEIGLELKEIILKPEARRSLL